MARRIVVTTSAPTTARQRRGKPRLLFRGTVRTMIRKVLARLNAIRNRDERENYRAAILDYVPALVDEGGSSATAASFDAVQARLAACLAAKEGDE